MIFGYGYNPYSVITLEASEDDFGVEFDEDNDGDIDSEEKLDGNEAEKARKLIDNIRKQALRAMASLADTPQSPEYENLKRIWQLCDKAVNEKEQEQQILNKQNGLQ